MMGDWCTVCTVFDFVKDTTVHALNDAIFIFLYRDRKSSDQAWLPTLPTNCSYPLDHIPTIGKVTEPYDWLRGKRRE
jgi:hypothetical protein